MALNVYLTDHLPLSQIIHLSAMMSNSHPGHPPLSQGVHVSARAFTVRASTSQPGHSRLSQSIHSEGIHLSARVFTSQPGRLRLSRASTSQPENPPFSLLPTVLNTLIHVNITTSAALRPKI